MTPRMVPSGEAWETGVRFRWWSVAMVENHDGTRMFDPYCIKCECQGEMLEP